MPGGLPPVLLTNTDTVTEKIDSSERVQVEDVAKLWRIYSLNHTHMEDDGAARLENFFWRMWGNRTIISSIRGNTLARLFITISEGGNRVRTTPVQTPHVTMPARNVEYSIAPAAQPGLSRVLSENGEQIAASPDTGDLSASPGRTSDQLRSLPPILKKDPTHSNEQPGSNKSLCSDVQNEDPTKRTARRESSESAVTLSPTGVGPAEKGSRSTAGRKRTSFAAPPGTRKARPGPMRKRSSQSSAAGEQRKGSQTSPLAAAPPGRTTPRSATGLPPALTIPTFALPSSSWQDVESPSSPRNTLKNTFDTPEQPSSWLVDKNFRGKFVEDRKRATSSINLAALGKSQSVRFLDELSEQKRPLGKGKMRAEEVGPENSRMVEGADCRPQPVDHMVAEDEECSDRDEKVALPRTKSQLSMLIDRERKYSEKTNLGPNAPNQLGANNQAEKNSDAEEENELLMMARRDKKGNARDPDQPFRAAAQKGLWKGSGLDDDNSDIGIGPGSPPPVF